MDKHPIDIAILVLIVTLETFFKVSIAITALILTIANWQPKMAPKSVSTLQTPFVHPLFAIGEELESMTAKTLRFTIGTKSRQAKHKLVSAFLSA